MKTGLAKDQISAVQEAMRESGQATDERPTRSLKPHNEEWTTGEGALSGALYSGDTWIGSFTNPERARLAVQAPALVRALSGLFMHHGHVDDCPGRLGVGSPCYTRCEAARTALNAAGVLE